MKPKLSSYIDNIWDNETLSSWISDINQHSSEAVLTVALYSTSAEDSDTNFCFLGDKETGFLQKKTI